jgi:hypothetical protein
LRINKDGVNVVNDILAIDASGALWVIELKSGRKLEELIKQCIAFSTSIESYKELFIKLISTVVKGIIWDGKSVKKMIIWPAATGKPRKKTRELIMANCIVPVTYAGKYTFVFEN